MTEAARLFRYRIHYARGAEMRYIGNLDMQLCWERLLRRARVPIAFSQGFNARPRFHMAAALPLGFTSRAEILDLWLTDAFDPGEVKAKLQNAAPPGLAIDTVEEIPLNLPALQTQVEESEYLAALREIPPDLDLDEALQGLWMAARLPREWRGKPYDLRALIFALHRVEANQAGHPVLEMILSAREGATGRPEEVLSALGIDPTTARVERVRLILASRLETPDPLLSEPQDRSEAEPIRAEDDR